MAREGEIKNDVAPVTTQYAHTSAVSAGEVLHIAGLGAIVALEAGDADETIAYQIRGLVQFPINTSITVSQGDRCYWDVSTNKVIKTSRSVDDFYLGVANKSGTATAGYVEIDLNKQSGDFEILIGENASVVGSAPIIGPTSAKTAISRIYADDNGAALGASAYRTLLARMLAAGTYVADVSIFGLQGQLKVTGTLGGAGNKAGVWGYLECASGAHLGSNRAGIYAMADLPSGAVIDTGCYLAGLLVGSNDLGGTHTGKAVCINVPNPVAGTWDGLLRVASSSGVIDTSYGVIDATKSLSVYVDDTRYVIPLYAAA